MITNAQAYKYFNDALTELRGIQYREAEEYEPWVKEVDKEVSTDCQMLNFIAEKLGL
jgi:hypothetical protein